MITIMDGKALLNLVKNDDDKKTIGDSTNDLKIYIDSRDWGMAGIIASQFKDQLETIKQRIPRQKDNII